MDNETGVRGVSVTNIGVAGNSQSGLGVYGSSDSRSGVAGYSSSDSGVDGNSSTGAGVSGASENSYGVYANSGSFVGLYATTRASGPYPAAQFNGDVEVDGTVSATSANASIKSFRIDHPLDPANKVLMHSCVESNERKLVYDGTVTTDATGEASVELPAYFGP